MLVILDAVVIVVIYVVIVIIVIVDVSIFVVVVVENGIIAASLRLPILFSPLLQ